MKTHTRIKTLCAELGITIRQLCQEAQVPEATVAAWKRKEPGSLETLARLEAAIEARRRKQLEEAEA